MKNNEMKAKENEEKKEKKEMKMKEEESENDRRKENIRKYLIRKKKMSRNQSKEILMKWRRNNVEAISINNIEENIRK